MIAAFEIHTIHLLVSFLGSRGDSNDVLSFASKSIFEKAQYIRTIVPHLKVSSQSVQVYDKYITFSLNFSYLGNVSPHWPEPGGSAKALGRAVRGVGLEVKDGP